MHPEGYARLQQGFGSAVGIDDIPRFKFTGELDESELVYMMMERGRTEMDITQFSGKINPLIFNAPYIDWGHYWGLEVNLPMLYRPSDDRDTTLTLPELRDVFSSLRDSIGGARYFEFTTRFEGDDEQIFITQIGALDTNRKSDSLPVPTREQVMLDGFKVETCPDTDVSAGAIVCQSSADTTALEEFDRSEAATNGYVLVTTADNYNEEKYMHFKRFRNMKAIVVLQSLMLGAYHDAPIQEHFIGYTEASGVPILTVRDRSIDYYWDELRGDDAEYVGDLFVRKGSFGVFSGGNGSESMIVDYSR